jgi:molecular chaperone Hsp33|tara:strand:- start:414 stop:1244 length:831 start_codon:yes stop_codon:yes gene_type:complete
VGFVAGSMSEPEPTSEPVFSIVSSFARGRNVLLAKANFSDLYIDYYLHLKDNGIEMDPKSDELLKTALAAFALHCVSRPRNEVLAWTINFQKPLINLFLGGDTETGAIVGRVFTENVKEAEENVFYQEVVRGNKPMHRSVVPFEGNDLLVAAETFYQRSEQRPARFFRLDEETFAIVSAHPDYDEEWFAELTAEDVVALDTTEEVNALETRPVIWFCGCNQQRILQALLPVWRQSEDELFLGEELIEINCPRCSGKYRISRETMEAFDRESKESTD